MRISVEDYPYFGLAALHKFTEAEITQLVPYTLTIEEMLIKIDWAWSYKLEAFILPLVLFHHLDHFRTSEPFIGVLFPSLRLVRSKGIVLERII